MLIKGKCDICTKKDGFRGHNLLECKTCKLTVHETCNGLISTNTKDPNWECMACQATQNGTLPRPTECALCSVSDGIHAMHPLYDTHGKKGKQVMLPPNKSKNLERRPAWVHTLCAMGIACNPNTKGCVYGCDKDGHFDGDGDSDIDEDDDSEEESNQVEKNKTNPNNGSEDQDNSDDELMSTHHFVIAHQVNGGKPDPWTKRIQEHRKLKCSLCGLSDTKNSLRIAVQCCFNDKHELQEFKNRHGEKDGKENCYIPMHVGCARWKKDDFGEESTHSRFFFYPGVEVTTSEDEAFSEPICNCFCNMHAKIIAEGKQKKSASTATVLTTSLGDEDISPSSNTTKPVSQSTTTSSSTSYSNININNNKRVSQQQPNKSSAVAAKELKRKEMEIQSQNQIREKRRQEMQQRQQKLIKKMTSDLDNTLLPLLRAVAEKSKIIAVRKERKLFWSKESKLGMNTFSRIWKTVEANVQESNVFKREYEIWVKKIQEQEQAIDIDVDDGEFMEVDGENANKETLVEDDSNSNETSEANVESLKPSTWEHLWHPNNEGVGFEFTNWDTFEYIDSV